MDYLKRTLDALNKQTLPKDSWELLLVDNASDTPILDSWDISWHPAARHIREDQLGLTAARLRGIKDSRGALLVFVDDDNILNEGFLESALEISGRMPHLGCFGAGILEPEFEEVPLDVLRSYTPMLALRSVMMDRWSNDPSDGWIPWGAGLVVTRKVADAFVLSVSNSNIRLMLGRQGVNLNSCEDDEFSWAACGLGLGKGIFKDLRVVHLIARQRVQRDYLLRLAEGHAYSRVLLLWGHNVVTAPPEEEPGVSRIALALITFRSNRILYEIRRWLRDRFRPKTEKQFLKASRIGERKAFQILNRTAR